MTAPAPERVHAYAPRGACARLWACRDPEVLVSGPAGTGKSRACLEKLHMTMLVNPGAKGLIVRKTLASLGSSALDTWRKFVVKEMLDTGDVVFYGGSAEEPPQYRYSNGSKVVVGGMDKPSRIMSTEYDMVYVQEATELGVTDWESLTTRLRNGRVSFQQLLADCNPDAPQHWLNQRAAAGAVTLLESRHEDNPVLFDDNGRMTDRGRDYLAKLDALTGVRYQRLRRGLWVAAEGIIFPEYDPTVHLVEPFKIPEDWTRWWTVDFGFRHPFVCQHWAEHPDGALYLYREFYMTGLTVDQHAAEIIEHVTEPHPNFRPDPHRRTPEPVHMRRGRWTEPPPRAIIADHDAEDRATLERELGRSTVKADKKVSKGIQAVQRRLRERRLFVFRDCRVRRDEQLAESKKPTCTAEEFASYVWADAANGQPKEQPVKEEDDGMDALRYMVAKKDGGGRPNIRFM